MHKKIGKILCILPIDFYFFIFLFFLTAATFGGCSSLRFFSSHLSMYAKYSLLLILQPPYLFFITLLYQKNKAMSSGFSIKFYSWDKGFFNPLPHFYYLLTKYTTPFTTVLSRVPFFTAFVTCGWTLFVDRSVSKVEL